LAGKAPAAWIEKLIKGIEKHRKNLLNPKNKK
jgi:hypothetical protein